VAGAGVRSIGGFLAPAGFDDSGQGPPEAVGVESDEPAVGEWTDVPNLVVVGSLLYVIQKWTTSFSSQGRITSTVL
jgi:hypothetical protein